MTAWVYMLQCSDGSYYVGSHRGDDLADRISEHQYGKDRNAYTFRRRPINLVWSERFERIVDAILAERRIKGWSRAKKEALVAGDFERVSSLAKRSRPMSSNDQESSS